MTAASRNGPAVSNDDQLVDSSCGRKVGCLKSRSTTTRFHHIGRFITSGCGLLVKEILMLVFSRSHVDMIRADVSAHSKVRLTSGLASGK
jgi:hypothetical protein